MTPTGISGGVWRRIVRCAQQAMGAWLVLGVLGGCAAAAVPDGSGRRTVAHGAYGAAWLHVYQAQSYRGRDAERSLDEWRQACALFEKALENDPDEPRILHALAACYLQMDRSSDAARLLVRAAETAPDSAESDMLMLLGLLPDAQAVIRVFDEALASEGRSDEARLRLLRTAGDY